MSEFEFEQQREPEKVLREGHALPWVPNKVRKRVRRLVDELDPVARQARSGLEPPDLDFGKLPIDFLKPHIAHFHRVMQALEKNLITPHLAIFTDARLREARLPTPVVPEPSEEPDADLAHRYLQTVEVLSSSGLNTVSRGPDVVREAFIDRAAEFAVRAQPPLYQQLGGDVARTGRLASGGLVLTEVYTNRHDDTVLVCLGYFASTARGFGVSSPAVGELSRGRYSFGILDGGQRRFDGLVWDCPARVKVSLP